MEDAETTSVLIALYKEASTRRRTADAKEAEVLAIESACRNASKLTAESALLTDVRLKREVEQAFNQHHLAGTGHRAAPLSSNALHPRQARQQTSIVDSLWQILTVSQPPSKSKSTSHQMPATAAERQLSSMVARKQTHLDAVIEHDNSADSFDTLLSQSIDVWQQLIGGSGSLAPVHVHDPCQPDAAVAAGVDISSSVLATSTKRPASVDKSVMHGISLPKLLSFVQLVHQQSSCLSTTKMPSAPALGAVSQQQQTELSRLARICSQNKQANMAYVGIGRSKLPQQAVGRSPAAPKQASGLQLVTAEPKGDAAAVQMQSLAAADSWQPRGHSSKRPAAVLAGKAIRFSRRQYRQQQQQQHQHHRLLAAKAQASVPASPRPKAIFQELTKQQPFARSVSTAAEMVKRRQALADLEMVPCTFHPALDPHSLALVATMASSYKAPHRVYSHMLPATRLAYDLASNMQISSGSAEGDSAQGPHAAAELASVSQVPMHAEAEITAGAPPSLGQYAVTSWQIEEQRALKECTFAPRLNANRRAKSVVAQQWQECHGDSDQAEHQHIVHSVRGGAAECKTQAAASAVAAKEADAGIEGSANNEPTGSALIQQPTAQAVVRFAQHQAPARSKPGRKAANMSFNRRQLDNSYVAAAQHLTRSHSACRSAKPHALPQQQQALQSDDAACDEAQLHADVAECDKRLEQHSKLKRGCDRRPQRQQRGAEMVIPTTVTDGDTQQQGDGLQPQLSRLKVALEAVLPDGSASRFEVQQADCLRHLTDCFATMLELDAGTTKSCSPAVVSQVV